MPESEYSKFLTALASNKRRISWFIGAGGSRSAGVPTAWDFTWQFKREVYCSETGVPLHRVRDLASPKIRRRIQSHFELETDSPSLGATSEYSHYFERAFSTQSERREFLEPYIEKSRPSYGHRVLAHLLLNEASRSVWTTNFDRTVEDAVFTASGSTTSLTISDLNTPEIASSAVSDRRYPMLVKLHGDYQSGHLMNLDAELGAQNSNMEQAFVEGMNDALLVIIGYSGRDDSVLSMMRRALFENGTDVRGFFWCTQFDEEPSQGVQELLEIARDNGIPSGIVRTRPFDEFMGSVGARLIEDRSSLNSLRPPRTATGDSPLLEPGLRGWPIVRLNAFPITKLPATACLIQCDIGGTAEVRQAIDDAKLKIFATRIQDGVVAFGSKENIEATFKPYSVRTVDEFDLAARMVRSPSIHRLFADALFAGFTNDDRFSVTQRRSTLYLSLKDPELDSKLSGLTDGTQGITNSGEEWHEVARLTIRNGEHFDHLIVAPAVFFPRERPRDAEFDPELSSFTNGRYSRRYNPKWNALLDFWREVLFSDNDELKLSAFSSTVEYPAEFLVSSSSVFSRGN